MMKSRGICMLVLGLLGACSRPGGKVPSPDAESVAPAPVAPVAKPKTGKVAGSKASAAKGAGGKASEPATSTAPGSAPDAGNEPPKIIEDDDLKVEESDSNPFSETVTLKLSVTPAVKATVNFGAKVVARLEPGKMEAELTRPRGSGPVDLEIKAEGYMPYHTRLYTGRNDKLGIRLYRPEEAPSVFGYKRSAEGKAERQEKSK
jgi:hypothetical protein